MRWIALVILGCVGCNDPKAVPEDPSAPKCVDVGKRVFEISGTLSEADHVARCGSYSPNLRRCYFTANDADGLAKCERSDMIAKGVDMEGPDCDEVWNHLVEAAALDTSAQNRRRPEVARTCAVMSKAQKQCWLKATTDDTMHLCARR